MAEPNRPEKINPEIARQLIRQLVLRRSYRFREHALEQVSARRIHVSEVEHVLATGIVVESRPDEIPPVLIVQGYVRSDEPLYVVCRLDPDVMVVTIITVHWQDPSKWKTDQERT